MRQMRRWRMRQEHVCDGSHSSVAIPVHRLPLEAPALCSSIHPRLPHDSPHPTASPLLLPRIHSRMIRLQTPTEGPLAKSLDLVARSHSHWHDVLRGLNERDIEQ